MGTGIGELCNTSSASVRPPSIAVCLMAPRRLRVFKLTPRQFRRSLSFYFTPSAPNLGQSNRFAKRIAFSKTGALDPARREKGSRSYWFRCSD